MKKNSRGFTLIELLIVIAIIAILAAIVFVALNPLKRFQDSRDSRRAADIEAILSAVKVNQVDNGGSYVTEITDDMSDGEVYMIGTDDTGGDTDCDTATTDGAIDLEGSAIVTGGYLAHMPISPSGAGSWDADHTGYTIQKDDTTGILTIRACESENTTEISTAR